MAGPFKGVSVSGYEIHSGVTTMRGDDESPGGEALSELETNEGERFADGFIKGNVCGTYLHGIFESGELLRRLSVFYLNRRGLPSETVKTAGDFNVHRQEQYDILADELRKALDMDKIYEIVGLKGE